ncbi:glycosyltransferase family 4 protein [Rossellomorea vietnamensis]|uniref:glycosyltransferase family 4 protein n=1 Tax=Rossellomorea vietnamensis TaxID=218284 RepID=UPI001CC91EE9|nr:glycosyltransferase family 4 protein [Rossellomorea vietnamensis]MCA0151578.1 glycosyltransferase family 4 protein [Rossellomorea vietnamensis]
MKKILIISQNFYPEIGSAGNRMKNIFLLLKERGYDVDILTTEPTYPTKKIFENEEFWDDPTIHDYESSIKRIKISNRKYTRGILNRLLFYLEMYFKFIMEVLFSRSKYQVVLATSPAIFVAMVGVIAKWRFRAKLILDVRDLWPESLKGVGVFNYKFILSFFNKVEKQIYKSSDEIIINSLGFKEHIVKVREINSSKLSFMPNSARVDEIRSNTPSDDRFKVIYAGNIGLAQDGDLLIKLAKELAEKKIDFTIIGYGLNRQEVYEEIKKEKLTNVRFISPKTRKECLKIISQHHIGIVTLNEKSVFETVLPGKVIDYMTCGVPIVAAVSGYSKQVIEDEHVGFVVEDRDSGKLVDLIEFLQLNKKVRHTMSQNGNKYVQKNFNWDANIDTLTKIIDKSIYSENYKRDKVENI